MERGEEPDRGIISYGKKDHGNKDEDFCKEKWGRKL